jgi:hypothetical protein
MLTVLSVDMVAVRGCTLQQAAALLTAAKPRDLNKAELQSLKGMINNSIVGASKLLHLVAPTRYPIWDSRLYRFCHGKRGHAYEVNKVDANLGCRRDLVALMADSRFPAFHAASTSRSATRLRVRVRSN